MAALTKPTVKINSVTYEAVPSVKIQGITDSTGTYDDLDFYWTGDATISAASQLLTGIKAYGPNGVITGNIPSKSSSDLTASGKTVTAPAGYYAEAASKSVADGSASVAVSTTSSVSGALSGSSTDGTPKITTGATPTVSAGWITTVSTSGTGDQYIKKGGATPAVTIGDASSALVTSSTGAGPTITLTPTASVGTAGWISSISNGTVVTRYIKGGSASTSLSMSGGPTTSGSTTSYTVSGIASISGTTGWVSDFTSSDSDSVVIPNAGITSFDMVSGNTTTNKLTVELGHMVSSTPTYYVGYVNGGSATINYGTIASAEIASIDGTAKNLQQVKDKILSDTTILGITGTCPTLAQDYVTDEISVDSTNVYLSVPSTGYYSTSAAIYGKFSGTNSILAAWDTENSTSYNTNRTSSDLTKSGKTVTAPAGYYNASASLSVDDGSASVNAAATSSYISDNSTTAGSTTYKITVNANPSVTAGWITSIGGTATKDYYVVTETKSITLTGSAQTINPSTGKLIRQISVPAVSLSAADIKTGVTYYGTTGTYTSDATATASQILSGATAYVNGNKITGNIANGSVTYTANTSTSVTTGAGYYATSVTTNVPSVTQDGTTKVLTIA